MSFLDRIKQQIVNSQAKTIQDNPGRPISGEVDDANYYAGRPMLTMMEAYVLDCIGHLPSERKRLACEIVNGVWGGGEDWKATIRQQIGLGDGADESFRGMWERNQETARRNDVELTPQQFARMVVDQNFAPMLD